jgi:hypothetical protein
MQVSGIAVALNIPTENLGCEAGCVLEFDEICGGKILLLSSGVELRSPNK